MAIIVCTEEEKKVFETIFEDNKEFMSHQKVVTNYYKCRDYDIPCKVGDVVHYENPELSDMHSFRDAYFIVGGIVIDEEETRIYDFKPNTVDIGHGLGTCIVYAREFHKFCTILPPEEAAELKPKLLENLYLKYGITNRTKSVVDGHKIFS